MYMMESGIGRKEPLDGRTPGTDREMGAGQGRQKGGNQTREYSHSIV